MRLSAYFCEWEDQHVLPNDSIVNGCITYPVEITDESSASSYGLPVVEIDGEPYGPADLPGGELQLPEEVYPQLRPLLERAGYPVCAAPVDASWLQRWERGREIDHWHPEARLVEF